MTDAFLCLTNFRSKRRLSDAIDEGDEDGLARRRRVIRQAIINMNGRVGDFGLARLSDHGKNFNTTKLVGTIGYIAPEMARTGKASTSSDVFAYGVLLLDVGCVRRPIDPDVQLEHLILMGQIYDASDPILNSSYDLDEMTLVLKLGFLCSHYWPQARPTMRQVVRFVNGDDKLS